MKVSDWLGTPLERLMMLPSAGGETGLIPRGAMGRQSSDRKSEAASHAMSRYLRHRTALNMSVDGFVKVDELLSEMNDRQSVPFTEEDIATAVRTNKNPEHHRDEKSCLQTTFLSLRQFLGPTETRKLSQKQLFCLRDKFLVSETKKLVSETTFLSQRQVFCLAFFVSVFMLTAKRDKTVVSLFLSRFLC